MVSFDDAGRDEQATQDLLGVYDNGICPGQEILPQAVPVVDVEPHARAVGKYQSWPFQYAGRTVRIVMPDPRFTMDREKLARIIASPAAVVEIRNYAHMPQVLQRAWRLCFAHLAFTGEWLEALLFTPGEWVEIRAFINRFQQ